MFWDSNDDDTDSTENIFAEDDVKEERRLVAIGQVRVLKDDGDGDDWDPLEESVIPRMPFFVPEGDE